MTRLTGSKTEILRAIAHKAMLDRGLQPDFSRQALTEVDHLQPPTPLAVNQGATAGGEVRDLRGRLWCSIDNDDSRDLDQLSVAEPLSGGNVKILVAIADVSILVNPGTAIDEHAACNTTSVYTAAQIFPMLPERLSTDLTSLNANQERLAFVIEMTVTPAGDIVASDVYRAMVLNRAKLAYNSVADWLDGKSAPPAAVSAVPGMFEQLRIQDQVAHALKELRHRNGALGLETVEARAVLENDEVTDLRIDAKNRAKELIEDFMIAANGVVARFLDKKGFPSLRRILRAPERWERIVELAAGLGEHLPPTPDAGALEQFLINRKKRDPERFADLSLSIVKLLGRGVYAVEPPGNHPQGHFGLAVRDYTHSTAPNRRFPDLITQRLLRAALAGQPVPYGNEELDRLANRCTVQEDAAAKVERQVRKSAAAQLLESHIGETFDGIVTGASPKGTYVRLLRPPVEGRIVRGFDGLDVGDRVRVRLDHTDVERGFVDFSRA